MHLYNVIATIINECCISFSREDLSNLRLVNKDYATIVPKVVHELRLDFTSLRKPQLEYENQECIDPHRVEMASAAMAHFGLDMGKFVRFISGEYTGQYQDVRRTLYAAKDHGTTDDYNHIKQVLMDGCPAQLTFEEPLRVTS